MAESRLPRSYASGAGARPGDVPAPRRDPDPDGEPPALDDPSAPDEPLLPPVPPAPRTDPAPPTSAFGPPGADVTGALRRARTALGLAEPPALVEQRVAVVVELDHARAICSSRHCTEWRALRAAAAFEEVSLAPAPVRERCEVEAVSGCTVGPSYVDLREGFFATRMELADPVPAGATAETRHRVRWWRGHERVPPASGFELRLPASFTAACLEVRFPPHRSPVRAEGFLADGQDEQVVGVEVESGVTGPLVRYRCGPAGPGVAADAERRVTVGLRWTW